jgi:hypothetical protein
MAAEAETSVPLHTSTVLNTVGKFERLQTNKIYTVFGKARAHLEKIATEFCTWEAQNMSRQGNVKRKT